MLITIQNRIQFTLLRVGSIIYNRRRVHNMVNPYCTIVFVKEGELLKEEGGVVHQVSSGEIMIHRAHSPVSVTSDKKGVHFIMNIDLHISAKSVFERKDIPGVIRLRDSSSFQETFLRLLDRWNEPDSAIRDMKVASLTTEIVSEIFEAFSSQRLLGDDAILTTYDAQGLKVNDGRFHQIIEYMERNPREQLTSEQMAVMAHLHPSAFSKAFKSVYGMTPKLMLRQVRLNQAKRLLEKESVTLEAIADECGFYDAAYFIRIFQKVFGQTPGEYRKRLKIFEGIKLLTS